MSEGKVNVRVGYHNPSFDEAAMRRKIVKNTCPAKGSVHMSFSYRQLFMELYKEKALCEARAMNLDDQLVFMLNHSKEYGYSQEEMMQALEPPVPSEDGKEQK